MASPDHSSPGRLLAKARPLSKQQREMLRSYVVRRRKLKAQEEHGKDLCVFGEEYPNNRTLESSLSGDDINTLRSSAVPGVSEQGEQLGDIKAQITVLQDRLVSLREEKHRLFQQLKNVLNEEDEERDKDPKHSECLMMPVPGDSVIGESVGGCVKPQSTPLELAYSHRQTQRGPLLPMPESSQLTRT